MSHSHLYLILRGYWKNRGSTFGLISKLMVKKKYVYLDSLGPPLLF